jgi:hypothetical protein
MQLIIKPYLWLGKNPEVLIKRFIITSTSGERHLVRQEHLLLLPIRIWINRKKEEAGQV